MYICADCGKTFEQPVVIHDDPSPPGVALPSGYYEYYECPYCGEGAVEEAEECPSCGQWYLPNMSAKVLCEDCKDRLTEELWAVMDGSGLSVDDFKEAVAEILEW